MTLWLQISQSLWHLWLWTRVDTMHAQLHRESCKAMSSSTHCQWPSSSIIFQHTLSPTSGPMQRLKTILAPSFTNLPLVILVSLPTTCQWLTHLLCTWEVPHRSTHLQPQLYVASPAWNMSSPSHLRSSLSHITIAGQNWPTCSVAITCHSVTKSTTTDLTSDTAPIYSLCQGGEDIEASSLSSQLKRLSSIWKESSCGIVKNQHVSLTQWQCYHYGWELWCLHQISFRTLALFQQGAHEMVHERREWTVWRAWYWNVAVSPYQNLGWRRQRWTLQSTSTSTDGYRWSPLDYKLKLDKHYMLPKRNNCSDDNTWHFKTRQWNGDAKSTVNLPDLTKYFQELIDSGVLIPGRAKTPKKVICGSTAHILAKGLTQPCPGTLAKAFHLNHTDRDMWLKSYSEDYNGPISHDTFTIINKSEYKALHDKTGNLQYRPWAYLPSKQTETVTQFEQNCISFYWAIMTICHGLKPTALHL